MVKLQRIAENLQRNAELQRIAEKLAKKCRK
jgi:hypothetical protein